MAAGLARGDDRLRCTRAPGSHARGGPNPRRWLAVNHARLGPGAAEVAARRRRGRGRGRGWRRALREVMTG